MSDLKIICSHCKRAYIIPEEDKEQWDCPKCHIGHAMGIGPCIPHSHDDEFTEKRRNNPCVG